MPQWLSAERRTRQDWAEIKSEIDRLVEAVAKQHQLDRGHTRARAGRGPTFAFIPISIIMFTTQEQFHEFVVFDLTLSGESAE